jgi:hypothetical protein
VVRRLLALALVLEGESRKDACRAALKTASAEKAAPESVADLRR